MSVTGVKETLQCYHCGDDCPDKSILLEEKYFCCDGCKMVFEILKENNLCTYYNLEQNPGISQKDKHADVKYGWLDEEDTVRRILDYQDKTHAKVTFFIPKIHCASCIWLLERLYKIKEGIKETQADFMRQEVTINFDPSKISLREVVELLDRLGYTPSLNLDKIENKQKPKTDNAFLYKLGIAAFAFGNIMLISFPEYLAGEGSIEEIFGKYFGYINLILALPVFLYSATYYYKSAWHGLRNGIINIDVPLALGIIVMFVRSSYEILSLTGAGFMDSLAGLVFFLLLGKWFQNKTYGSISFDRDYKSYFPIAVEVKKNGKTDQLPLSKVKKGDRLVIRNGEIIPADSILVKGDAWIDYSFVTGESNPVATSPGEYVYAGGKQKGSIVEVETVKEVSQSYLTRLWNHDLFKKEDREKITIFSSRVSKYFTPAIIAIAFASLFYWYNISSLTAWNAFTAVLIIACPCALALSSPFALGNTLRIFGKRGFYVKNTATVEAMADADVIVFDKTGTITSSDKSEIVFEGKTLNIDEKSMIRSLCHQSAHPMSKMLNQYFADVELHHVTNYAETTGKGILGNINGKSIKIGSAKFTGAKVDSDNIEDEKIRASEVYVTIDRETTGKFSIPGKLRPGIEETIQQLRANGYELHLLSGDNDSDKKRLSKLFGDEKYLHFFQSPEDKLKFIEDLQNQGKKVVMIGDGLNDAGALKQSHAGIAVSEDIHTFSPACDSVLEAAKAYKLADFLNFSKNSMTIVWFSFGLSLLYNVVGLSFAVTGNLSPLVAAILMPLSAVTIVSFVTSSTGLRAKYKNL